MVKIVKNCHECPFFLLDYDINCLHTGADSEMTFYFGSVQYNLTIHPSCPLKKEVFTVKVMEKNEQERTRR